MNFIEKWTSSDQLLAEVQKARGWITADLLTEATLAQVLAIALAFLLARLLTPRVTHGLDSRLISRIGEPRFRQIAYTLLGLTLPILWLITQLLTMPILAGLGWPQALPRTVVSLLGAWVVIRFTASLVRDPFWSRAVAVVAWAVAALNILGLLGDTTSFLDGFAFSLGKVKISALSVIKGAILLALLLWAANWLSALVDRRLTTFPRLTPSAQLLFGKLLKIGLFTVAVLVALASIGIDITALAVFTGAIGVGIGFGLQAIVSNFVAGIILLVERSLKIGDFVEVASGVRGIVRSINIRNTVITTNDNIDIIVPNSEFVNGTVTNWTFGDVYRRIHVPFGVAYGTDKELVRKAGLEAAAAVEYTLTAHPKREPQVWLVAFGDSSLNFELVVWLTPDAVKRPAAVNAAYCWELETALAKYGIEIPFPQRDLHIRSAPALRMGREMPNIVAGNGEDGEPDVH